MDKEIEKLFGLFLANSEEVLTELDTELVYLEKGDISEERLDNIRRHLHTIKGSCSMFGLHPASGLAHSLEDLMVTVIDQGGVSQRLGDMLFQGATMLRELIKTTSEPGQCEDSEELQKFRDDVQDAARSLSQTESGIRADFLKVRQEIEALREEVGEIMDFENLDKAMSRLDNALKDDNEEENIAEDEDEDLFIEESEESGEELKEPQTSSSPAKKGITQRLTAQTGSSGNGNVVERTVRIPEHRIDMFLETVGELISVAEVSKYLERQISSSGLDDRRMRELRHMSSELGDIAFSLQRDLMSLRRVPLKNIFSQFPRLVRDISKELGIKANLEIEGEDSAIDNSLLRMVESCLIQLVRNCLAHGLESPEERLAADKDETGTVSVKAVNEEKFLRVDVCDDGRGLDLQKVKNKAVGLGIITAEKAERMPDSEAGLLIFRSGLSTADNVGMASGRGVGLDIVENELRNQGGGVEVNTDFGSGTTISLRIPLDVTLSVISGMVTSSAGANFVIPTDRVSETIIVKPEMVTEIQGKGKTLKLRGNLLPLHSAASIFSFARTSNNKNISGVAVVITGQGKQAALEFSEVRDIQQVVVKNIAGLQLQPGLAGGAILGDGSVGLVLDTERLLEILC